MIGYVGSYASEKSQWIRRVEFDPVSEQFISNDAFLPWQDSKSLSLFQRQLVATGKQDGRAGIYWRDLTTGKTESVFLERQTSCFITQDEELIYTANYHEGTVLIYRKKAGLPLKQRLLIQKKAGCHQVLLANRFFLVPCLELDQLLVFERGKDYFLRRKVAFEKGTGPRHGVIDSHGNVYLVSERSNQLFHFRLDQNGNLCHQREIKLISPTEQALAAAVRLSKEEKHLYVSLRGLNEIVTIDAASFSILQRVSCNGDHPRDIALSLDGQYLFVANRFSNHLTVFRRNQKTGLLSLCAAETIVPEGVSLVFEEENDEK